MRLRIAPDSNRVMWLLRYAGEDLHLRLVPSDFMIGTKHDSHAHTGEKMPGLAGLMRGRVGMAGVSPATDLARANSVIPIEGWRPCRGSQYS